MHPSPLIAVPVFNAIRGGMLEEEEVSQPSPLCSALLSSCRVSEFFSVRPSSQKHVASIYSSLPSILSPGDIKSHGVKNCLWHVSDISSAIYWFTFD